MKDLPTLQEMQADDYPVASCETLEIEIKVNDDLIGEMPDRDRAWLLNDGPERSAERAHGKIRTALDKYLSDFTVPEGEDWQCPRCKKSLTGIMGMFGSFQYGITHGEGACECGYPCRADHYIKLPYMEKEYWLKMVLPYHPSVLEGPED